MEPTGNQRSLPVSVGALDVLTRSSCCTFPYPGVSARPKKQKNLKNSSLARLEALWWVMGVSGEWGWFGPGVWHACISFFRSHLHVCFFHTLYYVIQFFKNLRTPFWRRPSQFSPTSSPTHPSKKLINFLMHICSNYFFISFTLRPSHLRLILTSPIRHVFCADLIAVFIQVQIV